MPHTPRGRRSIGDADEPRGDEPRCLGITGLAEFSFFRRLSRRSAAAVSGRSVRRAPRRLRRHCARPRRGWRWAVLQALRISERFLSGRSQPPRIGKVLMF
eukprot:g2108.t1